MPLNPTYSVGTVSVSAGGSIVTGAGTQFIAAGIQQGDVFECAGLTVTIGGVDGATQLTLVKPWPGAAVSAGAYEIRYTPDASRVMAASRQAIAEFSSIMPRVEDAEIVASAADAKAVAAQRAAGKTPLDFGAAGDGVTDDTAALNAAVAADIPINGAGRTYRVISPIILPKRRHRWRDITIDGSGIPTNGQFTTSVVSLAGDLPTDIGTLTANLAKGGNSTTLSSVAGLAVGDWALIRSNKKMAETEVNGEITRHARACELIRVKAIAGNTVTFFSRAQDSYSTADGARIEKIQTVAGVDFENVTFIGADVGFDVSEGFESRYRNVRGLNQTAMGVDEDRCYRTRGTDWYFESQATEPNFTQAPYGLVYTGCIDCSYGDVNGLRTRHLTTTGSAGTSKGRTVSRGCALGDVTSIDSFASAVDQHPGGGFIQVGNVYVTFADNATQRFACQFQGGGGAVAAIESPNGGSLLFDGYGYFQESYTPAVNIASARPDMAEFGISASNYSNRYGTGQPQDFRFDVGRFDGVCGVGVSINPASGNISGGIASGHIRARPSLGMGRCFYATTTAGFTAAISNGQVFCEADAGARIIQVDGGSIAFSGGRLAGVGGNAEVRLANASMRLIGTGEANLVMALTNSQVLRATMA